MLRTARLLPHKGFRRWASTPTVTRDAASLLRGRLAATPAGLTPASNDEHGQSSTAHAINLQPSGHTAEEVEPVLFSDPTVMGWSV
jgi:hypothetical protein